MVYKWYSIFTSYVIDDKQQIIQKAKNYAKSGVEIPECNEFKRSTRLIKKDIKWLVSQGYKIIE